MSLVARTLSPEEIPRALAAGGPLTDLGLDPQKVADTMTVSVVEVDGAIVAYWVAWYALHLEPLWVHPDHRKSPGVIRALVDLTRQVAEGSGEPAAYCEIAPENQAIVGGYAERLGFVPAPGTLYYLLVRPPGAPPVDG